MIPDRCPNCRLFWAQGDDSRPFRVIAIYDPIQETITVVKCPRCECEYERGSFRKSKRHYLIGDEDGEIERLFRGTVLERTPEGDVPYPASLHYVCGLPQLYRAPLASAARIVSILDPRKPQPIELAGHEAKTLTVRFDDVVVREHGFRRPTRKDVAAILAFDRGAKEEDRLVVHCTAGLSRSTAAFVALLAQRRPGAEAAAFAELRAIRPMSWPNYLVLGFADAILGNGGALTRALIAHREIMAERYPGLFAQAIATGHDAVWDARREEILAE